jgi:hexosaminidase
MSVHRLRTSSSRRSLFAACLAAVVLVGIGVGVAIGVGPAHHDGPPTAAQKTAYASILPAPANVAAGGGQFTLTGSTGISAPSGSAAALGVADYLAKLLRPATGYALPVTTDGNGDIRLELDSAATGDEFGTEGYRLTVSDNQILIQANRPAGLFYGVQTLRQLLPPDIEQRTAQSTAWTVPSGAILDTPRFSYRAAGLDVARHFFTVAQVERYIDEISLYKIDYLHLHLTDDQGWRIAIDNWPNLTAVGARTEVGGGAGGYYTQAQYRQLVAYAQSRFVTIIPEIDVPAHVTAALASYPGLSCDGKPRTPFTGIGGAFSSLCAGKPLTDAFIDDVIGQLAKLTPGPYLGIGGDEAQATSAAAYSAMVDRAAGDARADGKIPWGWQETTAANVGTPDIAAYWHVEPPTAQFKQAANSGAKLVLMPANHAYLDQKYDQNTTLGLQWAGHVEVQDAYNWDPSTYLPGVNASAVLGVEADLWTETVASSSDIDYMAFPRLPAVAELGWSPAATHDWAAFRMRLAAQGPRWKALGISYYKSPQIPWPTGS